MQKRKDGSQLCALSSVAVIRDNEGNIVGAIAANREMGEAEEDLAPEASNQLI
jgi:hypothetical protein